MKEIVIATKNEHKIIEMKKMLEPLGYKVLTLFDFEEFPEIIEDGDTFKENALKKAKELSVYLHKTVVADDSGLEVFSLNNEPGVYSARYSGEHKSYEDNNKLLLENLKDIKDRKARFVTTICLYSLDEEPVFFEDYSYGKIGKKYEGTNGFGYDPIFYVPTHKKASAQLSPEQKNGISHRGKALQALLLELQALTI